MRNLKAREVHLRATAAMQSSISYEQVGDELGRDEEYSLLPSPPGLTPNIRTINRRCISSEQHQSAASRLAGCLSDDEPHTGPELSSIMAMSVDSLQLTSSDTTSSVSSIRDSGQPTFASHHSQATSASDRKEYAESYGSGLRPRATIQRDFSWCLTWFFDIVLTLLPLLFITIAALALRLDHQPLSDVGERAFAATRLGPTIFPIAFAATSSRFFQNLSRWYLERPNGIKLGVLEQISGSQSFPGAVQRTLTVRSEHWILSSIIILVWSLSPIGGQSSLRLFRHDHDTIEQKLDVYFANPEYQSSYFGSSSALSDFGNTINILYSGLLLSGPSQRGGPTDIWNRPRIPQLSQTILNNNSMGWYDISDPALQNIKHYSSLLGIDIRGMSQDVPERRVWFNVNSSYVDADCERVVTHRYKNITLPKSAESSFKPNFQNYTDRGDPISWWWNTESSGHRLYYDSHDHSGTTRFECVLRRIPVEVEFHCGPFPTAGCAARRLRQREERFDDAPPWVENELEVGVEKQLEAGRFQILPWSMNTVVVSNMLARWPTAAGPPETTDVASATDNYVAGDDILFQGQSLRDWDRDASDMTLFSQLVTSAFNTFFQVSLYPINVTNANSSFIGDMRSSAVLTSEWSGPYYDPIQATASDIRGIYIADRRWCATLLVVGLILQVLAIAGLCLRAWIAGPDILGFASSLTRDNPYFPESISSYGSALGGADRARLYKNMRVQLADVRHLEESGYIAFKLVLPRSDRNLASDKRTLNGKRFFS